MNRKLIKRGILVILLFSTILCSTVQADASELNKVSSLQIPEVGTVVDTIYIDPITANIELKMVEDRIVKNLAAQEGFFEGVAFAKVEKGSFLYIRKNAKSTAPWVGKIFANDLAKVIKVKGDWVKISSGEVVGYVRKEYLMTGKKAVKKAERLVLEANEVISIGVLDIETIEESFSAASSKKQIEKASKKKGKEVVAFANQFIGNPYVYGGMSLTNGADCSGFVKAVYANFGVTLPHSSYGMRHVGYEVSFDEMREGDIVCYPGHVGIYAGNGRIVNAVDEANGIKFSTVSYTTIISIRRIF